MSGFADLDELQNCLALKMMNNLLTPEEICAICLGLKKIKDFKVNNNYLRVALYKQLRAFRAKSDPLDDFFVITLMTTLSKGNLVFSDKPDLVADMLNAMELQLDHLGLNTAVKLLTFSVSLGFSNRKIEEHVFRCVRESVPLEPSDLVQLCSYASKHSSKDHPLQELLSSLDEQLDRIRDRDHLLEILRCYHDLSHQSVFSEKFNRIIFQEINAIPSEMFSKGSNVGTLAETIAAKLLERLGVSADTEGDSSIGRTDSKSVALLTRIPAFISSSSHLERTSESSDQSLLDPVKTHFLCRSHHRDLPMQVFVPQMDIGSLDKRSRQIVMCHRALVKFMGTESYVGLSRILPHFTEPDLVFGNIGGRNRP